MSETSHAGRFVWRELVSPDPAAAASFYGQIFGWTAESVPMGQAEPYTILKNDELGEQVAGAMKPMMDGIPPHWLDYITVDDVDAAHGRVAALGGQTITEVMDIPVGRFAVVQDPGGAVFALFQSSTPGASDTDRRPPLHTFCWSQLMTGAVEASVPFYEALFGWTSGDMPGGMKVFSRGEQAVASLMAFPEQSEDMHPHWLQYVAVDDTDATFAQATEAGASVYVQPQTIPGMGRFAVLADPTGAAFALWKDLGAQP